jgi:transposase InsO family protein
VLWLFLNKRNKLWHVKICHDAKIVLWLLTEMTTTSSDFMKIPQTTEEVAYQLMEIFCMFGAPFILQSDNGREFSSKIIRNLADMWPGMKLVHGKTRHSQSQGSVERSSQNVRDKLVAWISDNNT